MIQLAPKVNKPNQIGGLWRRQSAEDYITVIPERDI